MGNKPNWGAALSALGRGMYGVGMQNRRQDFIEEERRMRQKQMLLRQQIGLDAMDARQQAQFDDMQSRWDQSHPLVAPEGARMPAAMGGGEVPGAGMTIQEASARASLQAALNPQAEGAPEMTPYQEGMLGIAQDREARLGEAPEMTPYQMRSLELQEARLGQPSAMDKFLMQQAQREQDAIEREERKEFRDDVGDTQGAIFDDIRGKAGVLATGGWKPVPGDRNLFERKVDVSWGRDTTEQITLSELAAQRIAPQIADGEIDEFDYAVVRKLARNLGIDPMDVVSTWSPELQQQYISMEKNPVTKEQDGLMRRMQSGQ